MICHPPVSCSSSSFRDSRPPRRRLRRSGCDHRRVSRHLIAYRHLYFKKIQNLEFMANILCAFFPGTSSKIKQLYL
jgi:hypothetical protein